MNILPPPVTVIPLRKQPLYIKLLLKCKNLVLEAWSLQNFTRLNYIFSIKTNRFDTVEWSSLYPNLESEDVAKGTAETIAEDLAVAFVGLTACVTKIANDVISLHLSCNQSTIIYGRTPLKGLSLYQTLLATTMNCFEQGQALGLKNFIFKFAIPTEFQVHFPNMAVEKNIIFNIIISLLQDLRTKYHPTHFFSAVPKVAVVGVPIEPTWDIRFQASLNTIQSLKNPIIIPPPFLEKRKKTTACECVLQ